MSLIVLRNRCDDLVQHLTLHLNHFPSHERYSLSLSIKQTLYEIIALVVKVEKQYHNKTTLGNLDTSHEVLRTYVNLAFKLGYFAYHHGKNARCESEARQRYTGCSVIINEIGGMIGALIKQSK